MAAFTYNSGNGSPAYFDEFKEFLGIANDAKASEQTVTPTAVVEQPVAQEEVTVKEPVAQAPVQIDGMAGVKALQTLVEKLVAILMINIIT